MTVINTLYEHGGSDSLGAARFDFSSNANACGPCPQVLQAVLAADRSRYPDPAYTLLREQLAAFHGTAPECVVLGGSGSELIARLSLWAASCGIRFARVPAHGYGDYSRCAQQAGLELELSGQAPALVWHASPSSPLGCIEPMPQLRPSDVGVVDAVYEPLLLEQLAVQHAPQAWQLHSPNKALGLTGIRAAYLLAPVGMQREAQQLTQRAASWCVGAEGVAMLSAWVRPEVQQWRRESLGLLREYKAQLVAACQAWGWQVAPSATNFFSVRLPKPLQASEVAVLRERGIKLRDATSFGLPGWLRLSAQPPDSVHALAEAVENLNLKELT